MQPGTLLRLPLPSPSAVMWMIVRATPTLVVLQSWQTGQQSSEPRSVIEGYLRAGLLRVVRPEPRETPPQQAARPTPAGRAKGT